MLRLSHIASFLSRRALRVLAVLAAAVSVSASAQTDDDVPQPPRRHPSEMPKVATSADGAISVVAADIPGDPMGVRLPILQFATRTVRSLERAYKLEMPKGRSTAIAIHALDGTTNDVRVLSRWMAKSRMTRIWLPSPGFSDLDALRFHISKAWLRAWLDRRRAPGVPERLLPDWVVAGALRAADSAQAHDDVRATLELWSDARMPYFPQTCRYLQATEGTSAVLAGYVVGWMRERKIFRPALERLLDGRQWDADWLLTELTGETESVKQDRASDERLARLTRSVLSPGRASDWDLKVFTSRLLLYPPEFDKSIGTNRTSCTFGEAAALAAESETVRQAAWQKAREMPFCSIGRGESLAAAASAYRTFLLGVVRGEKPETLRPLLDEADRMMEKTLNENGKDDNRRR